MNINMIVNVSKKRICADVIASAFKMFDMTGLGLDQ